jgi:hypothetical protein
MNSGKRGRQKSARTYQKGGLSLTNVLQNYLARFCCKYGLKFGKKDGENSARTAKNVVLGRHKLRLRWHKLFARIQYCFGIKMMVEELAKSIKLMAILKEIHTKSLFIEKVVSMCAHVHTFTIEIL